MYKFQVRAPRTPGAQPTVVGEADTLADAREQARDFSRGRRDLHGHDVRIEDADGQRIEYAGLGD